MSNDNEDPQPIQYNEQYNVPLKYEGAFGDYNYTGIEQNKSRKGKSIKGLNSLVDIVASKNHQDIVRRNNYMPGQFDEWNRNPSGGNYKYWGGNDDLDNDGIYEFVVRRGDEQGPIVAVNGYTTKQSDWLARRKFYETNPTRELRKGKTVNSFMKDYYGPHYTIDGQIDRWTNKPDDDADYKKYHKMFNFHSPGPLSPFRAIGQFIVYPAIKQVFKELANGNEYLAKYVRKVVVETLRIKAYESYILSEIYNQIVRDKVLDYIHSKGALERIKQDYLIIKRATKGAQFNVDFENQQSAEYKEFERWLFAKSDIKNLVKDYVSKMLNTQAEQLKNELVNSLSQDIKNKIPNIADIAKELINEDLIKLQAKYK